MKANVKQLMWTIIFIKQRWRGVYAAGEMVFASRNSFSTKHN